MKIFIKILVSISVGIFFLFPTVIFAQEETSEREIHKGKIIKHMEVSCGGMGEESEYSCISYEVEVNEKIVTTLPTWINNPDDIFKDGKNVYISEGLDYMGEVVWNIESYSRENTLFVLFGVFVLLIVLIAGARGFRATLALIVTIVVLYFFAIPRINLGDSLFLISSISILVLLLASTFLTYGFNIKALISFISTFVGILIISSLGYIVIRILDISGTGEESSAMLFEAFGETFNLSSIFLLSIVIGSMGVLDDVTVGQTSSMIEIYGANKSLSSAELFKKSMNIGKDHITSMVNTLFVAYAGSSFSLVMLLSANTPNFNILLNTGFVVEEIVRTLVASIGLILVVPLTSFLASKLIVRVLK